jgi:predicted flap endonuclease-1-like 5' DNA nuclease
MDILLQEIWPCLLVATLIGTILGWWLRRCKRGKKSIKDTTELHALERMNHRNSEDNATFSDVLWEEEKKSLNEEIIQLRLKLSKAESEIKTVDTKLAAMESEYSYKLRAREANFYDRDSVTQKLKKELSAAEEKAKRVENKLKEREELFRKLEKDMAQEKEKLTKVELQAHYYENEISQLQKKIDMAAKEGEKFQLLERDKKESLSTEIEEIKREYDRELANLSEKLSEKEKMIDSYKEEIDTLKKSLEEEEEIASKKLYVMQNDYEFQIKKAHNEVKSSETQLEGLKEKLLRTQQLVETFKGDKEHLEKKLAEIESHPKEKKDNASELEAKLVQASLNNIKYNQEIATLKEEIEALKARFIQEKSAPISTVTKPTFLMQPEGKADNLQLIKGIGKKLEKVLNELGIFHFSQIASWNENEVAWVNNHLAFSGRIEREAWIEQARKLLHSEKGFKHEKRLHKK